MNLPVVRYEPVYPPPSPQAPQAPQIGDLLSILFLRWRSIVLVFLGVVGIVAFLVFYLLSPSYESNSTLVISSQDLILPVVEGAPASEYEKLAVFRTQKDVLSSTQVAEQVVDTLELGQHRVLSRLEKIKIGIADLKRQLGKLLGIERWQKPEDYRARAMNALIKGLEVEGTPDSQAVKLIYEANDPTEAANTLNTLVEVYKTYYYDQLKERASGLTAYLESQLADVNRQLAQTERDLLRFKRADRLNLGTSRRAATSEGGGLGDSTSGLSSGMGTPEPAINLLGITDSPAVQNEIKMRVLSMEEELRRLRTEFGERAPRVIELREKIRIYTEAIDKVPERQVDLIRLQRAYEINQDAAIHLRRNLERAKVITAADTQAISVITVLDAGAIEGEPVSPKRQLAMIAAVVLGLALGLMVALIRHYFDHSLRSPRDVETYLGVKLLGSLQVIR